MCVCLLWLCTHTVHAWLLVCLTFKSVCVGSVGGMGGVVHECCRLPQLTILGASLGNWLGIHVEFLRQCIICIVNSSLGDN